MPNDTEQAYFQGQVMSKLDAISKDITDLKDSSSRTNSDFENRIRFLEANANKSMGTAAALSVLISIIGVCAAILSTNFFIK